MDIIKIKKALYAAFKNDFEIQYYNNNCSSYCFAFYPLNEVYNGLLYIRFDENGKLNKSDTRIDYQYLHKTKKAEKLLANFCAALDGCTAKQMERIKPIFEYFEEKYKALYNTKYSFKIELYTESESIQAEDMQ